MLEIFFSSKTLSKDPMMMPMKVVLAFRQYIKSNRKKYGVTSKCSIAMVLFKIIIFILIRCSRILNHLHQQELLLIPKGYYLFLNNLWSAISPSEYILQRKKYMIGTLRADRQKSLKCHSTKIKNVRDGVWIDELYFLS